MKKSSKKKNNKKIDKFMLFISIALVLLLIIWVIKDNVDIKKDKEVASPYTDFKEITINDALKKMDEVGLLTIYVGYDECSACDSFVTKLSPLAEEFSVTVYYIDYKSADKDSKEWQEFTKRLNLQTSITINKDGENKTETKTFGEFLKTNGYTPLLALFDSGRMVNGSIGDIEEDSLQTKIESAGYVKNS